LAALDLATTETLCRSRTPAARTGAVRSAGTLTCRGARCATGSPTHTRSARRLRSGLRASPGRLAAGSVALVRAATTRWWATAH